MGFYIIGTQQKPGSDCPFSEFLFRFICFRIGGVTAIVQYTIFIGLDALALYPSLERRLNILSAFFSSLKAPSP
jgi:hypothetical protein